MSTPDHPDDAPLYQRDPHAWQAHLAEGNRVQPRKRVAAEVVIHDTGGRILLVDPSYKPPWDIPGGMAEANEPPAQTAWRELREELGLDIELGGLLCVDWVAPHGPWDDLLMFVFDGGVLGPAQAAALAPADEELRRAEFCGRGEAEQRLRADVWRRTRAALAALSTRTPVYLHNGRGPSAHPAP
ncbi:NUDIX hydrolase [Streptomonospora sp. S1-112]|uniref:NUDIX hydrolase n=1 Tax=Streptomonospora mangrovi TaxID=2883123 RepID=A0A9X3SEV9_9ACTN|nr:NUDIX hydrolase [Streptomonospora mangrovi]MDA0564150.1 NUDIX hydrolase [Streptomonospora mangrovi]